eukprot:gene35783-20788_t
MHEADGAVSIPHSNICRETSRKRALGSPGMIKEGLGRGMPGWAPADPDEGWQWQYGQEEDGR